VLPVRSHQRRRAADAASSQRDAEAINIAGSLRMQSYRLGYEMQRKPGAAKTPPVLAANAERACAAKLNRWYVPDNVKQRYQQLHLAWQEMDARSPAATARGIKRILRILSAASMPLCSRFSTTPNIKFSW
jgi:nitrate/nitrite-specific signal transduction histidine kinase